MNKGSVSLIALLLLQILMAVSVLLTQLVQSTLVVVDQPSLPMVELALLHYIQEAYDAFEDEDHTIELFELEIDLAFEGEKCVAFFEWNGRTVKMEVGFDFECNCLMESTLLFP